MTGKDPDEPLSDLADAVGEGEGDEGDGFEEMATKVPVEDDDSGGDDPDTDASDRDPEAPLGDLAARVENRRRDRGGDADYDDLFTEQQADDVDRETLWEQVTADEPTESVTEDERDVREVSKRAYCQGCEYFSDPPDVSCGHEGTEILEAVDLERFRVVNCPVVKEDERLGKASPGRDDGK
jgi:hypothetical protein